MLLEHKAMVFQVHRIICVWKTPFRKSGHIFVRELRTFGQVTFAAPTAR